MEKLYTVKEVAELLSMAEITIRLWLSEGKLKSVKVGPKAIRIPEGEIKKLLK